MPGSQSTVSDAPLSPAYRDLVEISPSFRLLHRLGLISPRCRPHALRGLYVRFGKRALDIVAAVIVLVLVSPILLVVALVSARIHGKPVSSGRCGSATARQNSACSSSAA